MIKVNFPTGLKKQLNPSVIISGLLVGVLTDFVFNAIFKISWFVIYAPCYVALSATYGSYILGTRWSQFMRSSTVMFLCGAFGIHILLANHHSSETYLMDLVSSSPITLRSKEWPQALFVTSEKLRQKTAQDPVQQNVPVSIRFITDYGCIQSFRVSTIAGVDVMLDPDATWTWRSDASDSIPWPGNSDQKWVWCRYRFVKPSG